MDNDEVINRPVNNHIKLGCEDELLHCSDKRTTASGVPINTSRVAVPKVLKKDCSGALKLGCEDQEAKVCGNEQCCSPPSSAGSPLPCLKSCCIRSERDAVPPHPATDLLCNGHDAHYNLFRSWINADLAVLSQSLPWSSSLSLWNHPLLQHSTCGQQMTGVINCSSISNSDLGMDVAKYSQLEHPTEGSDPQDIPLDLTMHHAGTRV